MAITPPLLPVASAVPDVLAEVVNALPRLPSSLRYNDELEDVIRSIRQPESATKFEVLAQGKKTCFDFSPFDPAHALLLKHVFAFSLAQDLSPITAMHYLVASRRLSRSDLEAVLMCEPAGIGALWMLLRSRELSQGTYLFVKQVLRLLAVHRLQNWSERYLHFLSHALPLPASDPYANAAKLSDSIIGTITYRPGVGEVSLDPACVACRIAQAGGG